MSIITDRIVNAYLETLLWSETLSSCDEDGNPRPLRIPDGKILLITVEDGAPLDSFLDTSDLPDLWPDLCPDVVAEARADLEAFGGYVEETLGFDPFEVFDADRVAHDFCLSRNGHGAGFFDGDYIVRHEDLSEEGQVKADMAEESGRDALNVARPLQDAAKTFGTLGLLVGVNDAGVLTVKNQNTTQYNAAHTREHPWQGMTAVHTARHTGKRMRSSRE